MIKKQFISRHGFLIKPIFVFCLLGFSSLANALCSDNGNGTFTCNGDTTLTDGLHIGTFQLDNSAAPINFTNVTTDPNFEITAPYFDFGFLITPGEYGSIIRNTSNNAEAASTVLIQDTQPVVINNTGAIIEMLGDSRIFNGNWSNDANGLLYNDGVLAGYAAAIRAGASVSSLIVNNTFVEDGGYYPGRTMSSGQMSAIYATGAYSAAILSNSKSLTVNNTSYIGHPWYGGGNIISYAGATYIAPAVQDGSQYATNVVAGSTVINNIQQGSILNPKNLGEVNAVTIGSIYVVDRNPMITAALQDNPALALAVHTDEVGPRNSVINNIGLALPRNPITSDGEYGIIGGTTINSIFLGSGNHVVNNENANIGNIYVDQRDSEVVDVTGGLANVLYKVHGDRAFTLNYLHSPNGIASLGTVEINDVIGSINTFNIATANGSFNTNLLTNGLGTNTLNYTCLATFTICSIANVNFTGITAMNTYGQRLVIDRDITVLGDMTIHNGLILNARDANPQLGPATYNTITANNVIIAGDGTLLAVPGNSEVLEASGLVGNQAIGKIQGNLINNGTLDLGNAILDVSGDVLMNSNSRWLLSIGPRGSALINSTGLTTFDNNSVIFATSKLGTRILDQAEFLIATNSAGIPTVHQNDGFLQWVLREENSGLMMKADIGVPDYLKPNVSEAAINATKALFNYGGDNKLAMRLQADLLQVSGVDVARTAERLHPEVNDGLIRMVLGSTDKLFNMVGSRLISQSLPIISKSSSVSNEPTRLVDLGIGTLTDASSAASVPSNIGLWVQGFGDRGIQERMSNIDGFEFSSVGFATGMDRSLDISSADYRVGIAGSFTRSNIVNTGHTVNNRLDANSYMLAAYGSRATDDFFINATVGAGLNTLESRRQLFNYSSVGERPAWQFSARLDAGMPFSLSDNLTFIPIASIDYTHLREQGYKENSTLKQPLTTRDPGSPYDNGVVVDGLQVFVDAAAPTNLAVEGRTFNSYRGGLGGRLVYSMQEPSWGADLELHGMYRHEFGDIAPDTYARFRVGGASFVSPSLQPVRNDFLFGGSVKLFADDENDQISFLTSYDANIRDKYFGQTVSLSVRYDFDKASDYKKKAQDRLANMLAKSGGDEAKVKKLREEQRQQTALKAQLTEKEKIRQEIDDTIKNWAIAISNKNTEVYFNTYASNFVSQDGVTKQQWERKRRIEFARLPNAIVKLSDITIEHTGHQALAVFVETAADGSKRTSTEKILELEQKNGKWLIVSEDSALYE